VSTVTLYTKNNTDWVAASFELQAALAHANTVTPSNDASAGTTSTWSMVIHPHRLFVKCGGPAITKDCGDDKC
jgi:hypothetical protein